MSAKSTTNYSRAGVIRAEEFQVVDKQGNIRGSFYVKADGSPRLELVQGTASVDLEIDPDGAVSLVMKRAGSEDVFLEFGVDARLLKGDNGVYDIVADGKLVFSKHEAGRFPENDEVIALLGDG